MKVSTKWIRLYVRSKREIYNFCQRGLKYYLPSYRCCPVYYLKRLLYRSITPVELDKFKQVFVPKWEEFKTKTFYDFAKTDSRFKHYLPKYKE